ncbi:hypothetical protein ACIRQY_33885 [Streptomyces sp. NPDC101490]|uniref:hypothetical protein n=1 Tax=Streptomyces sp. NPDC101490 TaxID=3366143 RepID=UPI0037FEB567
MRRALSSAVVCVALLTAGCATTGPDNPAAAPKSTAPTASASATAEADHSRTVRAAVEALATARTFYRWEAGQTGGKAYVLTGKGGHDFTRRQGTLEVRLEDVARVEHVFTPERLYLRTTTKKESADWMFTDRSGIKAERLLKTPGNDPEFLLRQVVKAERYRKIGTEKVAGASTTLYRGELTHAALTLDMSAEARKKTDQIRDMLGGTIPATAEVWIDGRGRLTQLRLEMDLKATMRTTTTLALVGHGEPLKVQIPTDAAEADASHLA